LIDLGVDVPVATFIDTIKANPDTKLVALSCLLTTTMPAMKETAAAIKGSGLSGFKMIVGGAPINKEFADQIGADGYAEDAAGAAILARKMVS
jgi:methanogenic corrinoid protein MtbC1